MVCACDAPRNRDPTRSPAPAAGAVIMIRKEREPRPGGSAEGWS